MIISIDTSVDDLNMYLSGVYCKPSFHHKPVRILSFEEYDGEVEVSFREKTEYGMSANTARIDGDIQINKPDLGFKMVGRFPVYLSYRQGGGNWGLGYKKGVTDEKVNIEIPQNNELLKLITEQDGLFTDGFMSEYETVFVRDKQALILKESEFLSPSTALRILKTRMAFGAVLHKNYAIIMLSSHEFPVILFKNKPIAEFVNWKDLKPIGSSVFIDKLFFELGVTEEDFSCDWA